MRQKFHFWIRQTGKIGEERGNFHAPVFTAACSQSSNGGATQVPTDR